jgi:hypothetical protein
MNLVVYTIGLLLAVLSPSAGTSAPHAAVVPGPVTAPPADEATDMRALLVFVQFRDDFFDDPGLEARGWPLYADRSSLPSFAMDLLAEDPSTILDSEVTLSRYLYDQSRHAAHLPGRFRLVGDTHPRNADRRPITYLTRHPNEYYHRANGRGYGHLVQEVLDHIFIEQGIDPAHYDLTGDGYLDHVFLIIRTDVAQTSRGGRVSYSGSSYLGGYEAMGGTPSDAPAYWSASRQQEVKVDWQMSGSFLFTHTAGNMVTQKYHVNLMAHELGHELFREAMRSVHLMPVTRNRVPANEPQPTRARDYRYGFALMPGSPYTNGGGLLTISAHERSLLGWISLDTLGGGDRHVTVGDLYTTADAFVIPLPAGEHRIYLTNHQRVSYFDRIHRSSRFAFNPPYDSVAVGLSTTGLLVTFSTAPNNMDVLAANNELELTSWFLPNPSPYDGIMYGPETSRQITPWTRPNINGCNGYAGDPLCASGDFEIGWMAVDDIRYRGRDDHAMVFDYIDDFRERPVVRSDSWIEPGSDGEIAGDMRITDGATLRIVSGSTVSFGGRLTIEPGTEVIIEEGANVTLGIVDVRTGGRLTRE